MKRSTPLALWLLAGIIPAAAAMDATLQWSSQVQPLFDVHCVKCHGPIEQKSGLELDTPAAVLKGGDEGPVVVPGQPERSRLYQYLAPGSDPHMPPKKQLTEAQREVVRAWITALGHGESDPNLVDALPSRQSLRPFDSVTAMIDVLLAESWAKRGIQPAAPADDRTWCRRVYLDLAGRIPTGPEQEAFLQAPAASRRAEWVDRLLVSDEYAVRMREVWDVLLMGRALRDAHEERRQKNGWWAFLEQAFRANHPWNETVRTFLIGRPDDAATPGAAWFLYERRNQHQAIAEAVAPIVYGTKIDCAQCHDHPLAREIKQAHYWGLVAAFNRSKNVDGATAVAESAIGGFVNFTNLKKESQPAVLALLTGRIIDEPRPPAEVKENDSDERYVDPKAKVRVPKFSRRAAFAEAATQDNPLLARAFVNRMWAVLFGRGLVDPADQINARNRPSHPELLERLTEDFVAQRQDVRRLVRGMVLSRAYGHGWGDAPPESFAAALERPLMAEQLARSWRVALGLPPEDRSVRRALIAAMPDAFAREYHATFQQAQFLSDSPALAAMLQSEGAAQLGRIAALPNLADRVTKAFSAVYGRPPDGDELIRATAFLAERDGRPVDGVRDLFWALLTSAEGLTMP